MSEFFRRTITKDESRDTGMGVVLLLLLLFISTRRSVFLLSAVVLHAVNMIVPKMFRPVAVVWLGVSHLIGMVVSKVVLSLVYFVVVTPIGLLRRLSGHDSLKLQAFKASTDSVMVRRNHTFMGSDLEKPY
jgi:hypothetical protein